MLSGDSESDKDSSDDEVYDDGWDEDNEEGEKRAVEREAGHGGECFAVAVEEVTEEVDDLIGDDHMPWFNYTGSGQLTATPTVRPYLQIGVAQLPATHQAARGVGRSARNGGAVSVSLGHCRRHPRPAACLSAGELGRHQRCRSTVSRR